MAEKETKAVTRKASSSLVKGQIRVIFTGSTLVTTEIEGDTFEITSDNNVVAHTDRAVGVQTSATTVTATQKTVQDSCDKFFGVVSFFDTRIDPGPGAAGPSIQTKGVVLHEPITEVQAAGLLKVGESDEQGWKYVATLADGSALFALPGSKGVMNWKKATKAAKEVQKQGKVDEAHLPAPDEMRMVFASGIEIEGTIEAQGEKRTSVGRRLKNAVFRGRDTQGDPEAFWTSAENGESAWGLKPDNTKQFRSKNDNLSVLLVSTRKPTL